MLLCMGDYYAQRKLTAKESRSKDSTRQWPVSLLTQKQPGLNNANLQVQAKVLHIATTTPTAGLRFHNFNCGIFPGLYKFLSSQRGHPGALLPKVIPGECLDFLVQGVHYMSGGEKATDTKTHRPHRASLPGAEPCRCQPLGLQTGKPSPAVPSAAVRRELIGC